MAGERVLILGCGPSGLLAAHAVERLGGEPVIMSVKRKSPLLGAQYLHVEIPDLTGEPDGVVRTVWEGTREGYAAKVYGSTGYATSWRLATPEREVWSLRRIYDILWDRYQDGVIDAEISRTDLAEAERAYPLVISTIPATRLCAPEWRRPMEGIDHRFHHQVMYVGDFSPSKEQGNVVVYDGRPEVPYYRTSRVFGCEQTEFSAASMDFKAEYADIPILADTQHGYELRKGIKVVATDCDCFPRIKRAGRYGTWRKGYLTHHAFRDATNYYREAFGLEEEDPS